MGDGGIAQTLRQNIIVSYFLQSAIDMKLHNESLLSYYLRSHAGEIMRRIDQIVFFRGAYVTLPSSTNSLSMQVCSVRAVDCNLHANDPRVLWNIVPHYN